MIHLSVNTLLVQFVPKSKNQNINHRFYLIENLQTDTVKK